MKCLIVLSIMTVGCALAQNVNDGRYYPEVYASKFDDGKWRPDNNGQYRGTPDKFGAGSGSGSRFGGASSVPVVNTFVAPVAPAPAPVVVANPGAGLGFGSGAGFGSGFGSAGAKKSSFGSGSSNGQNVGVKEDTRELNEDGSYFYKVLSDNDIEFSETGRVENLGADASAMRVKGYYEFVGDDGVRYRVDYIADENGFQPTGDHLPTPPPIPEEIYESLKAQGLI
ncbi:AAEL003225-PA [Aedes aegypti]|uniref:AAEL003225-PA n=1 Tax=Aedes aegypti TaxID=7159 RepID=Q17G18_AEDAE|nr:AAEL003225-PA [Aedes aegypti]